MDQRATTTLSTHDEALMLAYAEGDQTAFEILYGRHKNWLYRVLLRQTGEAARAHDVFQETWLTVIRSAAQYQPTAKFSSWLYRLARQRLIDCWRKQQPEKFHAAFNQEVDDARDALLDLPDPAPIPDEWLARKQLAVLLVQALDTLPATQREIFLLVEEGGMTVPEVAQTLDDHPEAIKSRLRYARAKLRQALAQHIHDSSITDA